MCKFFSEIGLVDKYKRIVAELVYGLPSEKEDRELRNEVNDYAMQYAYRKEFHLSWKEFRDEPYRVFLMNSLIMNISNDRVNNMNKKTSRGARSKS